MTWDDARHIDLTKMSGGSDCGEEHWGDLPMTGAVPRSFEVAFADLYRLAYRVGFRILGDRSDAEDVAQETLARAALRWSRLHEKPEGWITRVAANQAIDRYRRRQRQPTVPRGPLGIVDERLGERGDLVAALRKLPRRQREIIVMRYVADLSEADVARALGCSVGAVKSQASRGLASLRRHLDGPPETDGDDVRAS
jgi:RNA polymerase sigma-70 factor (sigma-E family)